MKKTIITVFAFMVVFGFAVSGAMAQVTWSNPYPITPPTVPATKYVEIEYFPLNNVLTGKDDRDGFSQVITTTAVAPTTLTFGDTVITGQALKSVIAPPAGIEYAIDADTVAIVVGNNEYDALDPQPFVPINEGEFKSIAVGDDGTLYVLFEADNGSQYLLVGYSNWEIVTVRFAPRFLNLGSNGNWVTCKISDFPDGYAPADVDMDRVCIVAVMVNSLPKLPILSAARILVAPSTTAIKRN